MSRFIVSLLFLAVSLHLSYTAILTRIDVKIIAKKKELATTRQTLADTITLQVNDVNTAANALGSTLSTIVNTAKKSLTPFIADSITSGVAKQALEGLTAASEYHASTVTNWKNKVISLFNNVINSASSQLTANSTSMFDALVSAENAYNSDVTSTTSSYKNTCKVRYMMSTSAIADSGTTGFQTFMNAELTAFSRTKKAIADYTNIVADNLRSITTSTTYCTSIGLTRKNLKARAAACLSSFVSYALPQLKINLQYQVDIVNQLIELETGNSMTRINTGFDSTTTSAITAAKNLSSDVASCLSTGA